MSALVIEYYVWCGRKIRTVCLRDFCLQSCKLGLPTFYSGKVNHIRFANNGGSFASTEFSFSAPTARSGIDRRPPFQYEFSISNIFKTSTQIVSRNFILYFLFQHLFKQTKSILDLV